MQNPTQACNEGYKVLPHPKSLKNRFSFSFLLNDKSHIEKEFYRICGLLLEAHSEQTEVLRCVTDKHRGGKYSGI